MKLFHSGLLALLMLFLVACTILTHENFEKIKPGMSMQEVVTIIGEPTKTESVNFLGFSGTSATWKSGDTVVTIVFLNNQVQIKSFIQNDKKDKQVKLEMPIEDDITADVHS